MTSAAATKLREFKDHSYVEESGKNVYRKGRDVNGLYPSQFARVHPEIVVPDDNISNGTALDLSSLLPDATLMAQVKDTRRPPVAMGESPPAAYRDPDPPRPAKPPTLHKVQRDVYGMPVMWETTYHNAFNTEKQLNRF
ncbi:Hypp7675 [Branchiostoma lanceolatum]|uniref:Hypp7675 protein n=1 Tax=Branchiostoma lanceolatum TaxID=7740 RepID=A0A8K0EEP0_BRALA|nr:Hypp7675 [Branchiostoma lanceolatum]